MEIGDLVVRKSYGKDITFKVIEIIDGENEKIYMLKGVNLRIEADATESDLERVSSVNLSKADIIFNEKINNSLRKVIAEREQQSVMVFNSKKKQQKEKSKERKKSRTREGKSISVEIGDENKKLVFGRPGRILHIDGDSEYLEVCLKTYKQLSLQAVGRAIAEKDQPERIIELVNEVKPDIVVITGHDGMIRHATDYMDINNYRNTKYFVETVRKLREYESSYDELVIFAGACQSCYEAILDAGAN